jgi:GMP synthase-like glutamine amidotransferase
MDSLSSAIPAEPGLILQHGVDGPPGRLGEWLDERGIPYDVHRADEAPPPADVVDRPWIASLGSERSATLPAPSWPADEVAALRRAVAAGVPVLGLCFGGQALSLALGGAVHPSDPVEIGWIAVEPVDGTVPPGPWFQWHFELLEVPPGGVELARSPAGPAAFRLGPHLGTQFHPEVTPAIVRRWAELAGDGLPGITADELNRQTAVHGGDAVRAQAFALFDAWWALRGQAVVA